MNSLDTNVVLRFLLNDIPEQAEKAKAVIAKSQCYVTDVVITEVIYVLEKAIGLERGDVVRLVEKFLGLSNLVYNPYFMDQTIELYKSAKSLSFVDCYAAMESKVYQNSLLTFDKQLVKRGGPHVKEL